MPNQTAKSRNALKTRIYNKRVQIEPGTTVVIKSYDRTFTLPSLGWYLDVDAYHAENLIARNPAIWTTDANEARNATLAPLASEAPVVNEDEIIRLYNELMAAKEAPATEPKKSKKTTASSEEN